ncbi:potassium-transporting ATPase subunit KdpA [Ileibacterium valens]|uniref:potassium-transporting ATPase subunit KdpA n=1 Tax=Ileibacterium valens TaxID=1862668 RepID=UPI00272C5C77|nr:potassium-transporting ATPase subunit KdpA [Ileibacterium valens]
MNAIIMILLLTFLCSIPLGIWCKKVMNRDIPWINKVEDWILDRLKISAGEMGWKKYLAGIAALSILSFVVLFGMLIASRMDLPMAFNTAVSYITNTNWQSFNPMLEGNWIVQILGFGVQNFISAAIGICVLFALIRGLIAKQKSSLGNLWQDLIGSLLFILLPVNLVGSIILAGQGVPMQMQSYETSALIEPIAVDEKELPIENAQVIEDQVFVDGKEMKEARIIKEQVVPMGMMASIESIKQSGTNGGGLSSSNSASPFENPTGLSNAIETGLILLIPMSLCFSFGAMVKNKKQGLAFFASMAILFGLALIFILQSEMAAASLEGKEVRIGLMPSALWSASTTAASSGSSNMAMNSMSSIASLVCMVLMQVGEVIFGGVGSGLYGLLAFVILSVFIAGLMVGRTPEFMGKKIEPFEMKWAVILCLVSPVCILIGSALGCIYAPEGLNMGAHGFSQILYAYTSMGSNNGSAMAGFESSQTLLLVAGGIMMLLARFIPIAGALAMGSSLGSKKISAQSAGSLKSDTPMFVFLLVLVILLVGALSYFPALSLGPIAEFFG